MRESLSATVWSRCAELTPLGCPPPPCRQVVLGYCWVAFACTAANILAGTLLYVRSAHDDFRRGCAALFRGAGTQISRCVRGRSRLCVWSAASIQRLHSKGSFLYLKCT